MNIVYRCVWTEYEKGWGSRPDGVTYALTEEQLKTEIKRQEDCGDYECFSRASEISQALVNDELLAKIKANTITRGTFTTWRLEDPGYLGAFTPVEV